MKTNKDKMLVLHQKMATSIDSIRPKRALIEAEFMKLFMCETTPDNWTGYSISGEIIAESPDKQKVLSKVMAQSFVAPQVLKIE